MVRFSFARSSGALCPLKEYKIAAVLMKHEAHFSVVGRWL
jgi:hypothetical protein